MYQSRVCKYNCQTIFYYNFIYLLGINHNLISYIKFCKVPSNTGYSKDTAMMWQQGGQYLPESGIHSGGTTQAHSITDKEDDLERDQLIYELNQGFSHGFTQDQVDGK